jgi:hypothetical protein
MKNQIINFIGTANYQGDDLGTYIWGNRPDGTREIIAVVYGYQIEIEQTEGIKQAEHFQDELGKFIAEAINDKIKTDYSYEGLLKEVKLVDYEPPISLRLINCLKYGEVRLGFNKQEINIIYVEDLFNLRNYTRNQIYCIKNFGRKSQWELDKLMADFEIKFKGE